MASQIFDEFELQLLDTYIVITSSYKYDTCNHKGRYLVSIDNDKWT